jgi:hypothetical protein
LNNKGLKPKKIMKRVTFDVVIFPGDSKGLRVEDRVVINIKGVSKTGTIERIFHYPDKNKHEAKIKCDDGMRNYKTEKDITKV